MTPFKQLLEEKGLKQSWIAKQLGVTRETVSSWATGDFSPSITNQRKLGKLLGLSAIEVYTLFFNVNTNIKVSG